MGCTFSRTATAAHEPEDADDANPAPLQELHHDQPPAQSRSRSFAQQLRRATGQTDARDRNPPPRDPVLAARARALQERAASDGAVVLSAGSEAGAWLDATPLARTGSEAQSAAAAAAVAAGLSSAAATTTPTPRRLRDNYVRATLVSYGASCKVFVAHDRQRGERVAVKTIPKSRRDPLRQRRRVEREIGALVALRGHPHVVRFVEAFEDARSYHVVMEHLSGGELFEHLSSAGPLTEATARRVGRALLRLLAHCHARGIAHMDVKPENIMFDADGPGGVLKVIDFGSAEWVLGAQEVSGAFGTVRYSSPEMANASAGQKSDVWSVGVVLYTLISGKAPFLKDSDAKTLEMIARGPKVKFSPARRWARVSPAARAAIRAMLEPDPADRPEAARALELGWFATPDEDEDEVGVAGVGGAAATAAAATAAASSAAAATAPHHPSPTKPRRAPAQLDSTVVDALRGFACHSRARRLVMGVLAQALRGGEAARLVATFLSLDADFDGSVSLDELRAAARRAAPHVTDAEMARVFRALDVDNTGTVDAREFVAGVLHRGGGRLPAAARAAVAERTFRQLDAAAAGFFTRDAFRSFLALSVPRGVYTPGADPRLDRELDAEFDAMDENGDGRVTWEEFRGAVESAVAGRGGGGGGGGDGASGSGSYDGGDFTSDGGVSEASDGGYASDGGFGGSDGGGGGDGGPSSSGATTGTAAVGGGGPSRCVRGASPLGRPHSGAAGVTGASGEGGIGGGR